MKTWRVSLTYRVKSAHKVKLTDKQLLQWMVPILLVMGIYLGTWTAAEPPHATEVISLTTIFDLSVNNVFVATLMIDQRYRRINFQTVQLQLVGPCHGDWRSSLPALGHSCLSWSS